MPKTYKNLYPDIYAFDNLLVAYYLARRGKHNIDELHPFCLNHEVIFSSMLIAC